MIGKSSCDWQLICCDISYSNVLQIGAVWIRADIFEFRIFSYLFLYYNSTNSIQEVKLLGRLHCKEACLV